MILASDATNNYFPSINGSFLQFRRQSRLGRDRSGVACETYTSKPPRDVVAFLELAENCSFKDRKLIRALHKVADGH
jgi:hypothetical protein